MCYENNRTTSQQEHSQNYLQLIENIPLQVAGMQLRSTVFAFPYQQRTAVGFLCVSLPSNV